MRTVILIAASAALAASCTSIKEKVTFSKSQKLGGKVVSAETLNEGREHYMHYCFACHGMSGEGNGPAARWYRPAPRNLHQGLYKFGGVVDGLPHDDDFVRILRHGLWGTPMLAWDIPDRELMPIIQYIKTFADAWHEDDSLGQQIDVGTNPWKGKDKEAVARGAKIYHGLATCHQCHAAYMTKQEIYQASLEVGNKPITEFRANPYQPEAKESEYLAGKKKLVILPPDFLFNKVRSGAEVESLYRIISAGIPGTAMPSWHGALPDPDIWAMAYFVKSLIDMNGTPPAFALRERLATQPQFVPPPAPPTPAPAPAAPGGAAAPAPAGAAPAGKATEAAKPADAKPADAKPADAKPADAKPADAKPADAKPADAKPADAKPAETAQPKSP